MKNITGRGKRRAATIVVFPRISRVSLMDARALLFIRLFGPLPFPLPNARHFVLFLVPNSRFPKFVNSRRSRTRFRGKTMIFSCFVLYLLVYFVQSETGTRRGHRFSKPYTIVFQSLPILPERNEEPDAERKKKNWFWNQNYIGHRFD